MDGNAFAGLGPPSEGLGAENYSGEPDITSGAFRLTDVSSSPLSSHARVFC
jgi:hypothetical protein